MIGTKRLILRRWEQRDRAPFAAMGQDPRVMATLGPLLSRAQSDAAIERLEDAQARHGFTFWAAERRDGAFLGFCGLQRGPAGTPIDGKVEIGWRLAHEHWGKGYAREAAAATIDWFWEHTDHDRLWSITTPGNTRSWGLMKRLGMRRTPGGDFAHPALPAGDPLRAHISYALERPVDQGAGSFAPTLAIASACRVASASARARSASSAG